MASASSAMKKHAQSITVDEEDKPSSVAGAGANKKEKDDEDDEQNKSRLDISPDDHPHQTFDHSFDNKMKVKVGVTTRHRAVGDPTRRSSQEGSNSDTSLIIFN